MGVVVSSHVYLSTWLSSRFQEATALGLCLRLKDWRVVYGVGGFRLGLGLRVQCLGPNGASGLGFKDPRPRLYLNRPVLSSHNGGSCV